MKSDKSAPVAAAKPRGNAPARAKTPPAGAARTEVTAPEGPQTPGDEVVAKGSDNGRGAAQADVPAVAEEPEEVVAMSKEQVKQQARKPAAPAAPAVPTPKATFDEVDRFNRENVEAVMQVATAVARCYEEIGTEWANYAKASMDEGVAASMALMGCTSMQEAIDVQTGYAKTAVDHYLSESARLSEISLKMANQALEPLNTRFSVAAEAPSRPVST